MRFLRREFGFWVERVEGVEGVEGKTREREREREGE